MNRRGEHVLNERSRTPRKISNCFKDREEELSFFRDLQKREKEQVASLLQPVSEDFEDNGNYGVYRMESGGRKVSGLENLAESGKNDYNWLKTPPATPLFPSLEMETNAPEQLVLQREIPILQPLSRFAGNPEGKKKTTNRSTSPNSKPKLPQRAKTPSERPSIPSLIIDKKNMKSAPITNQKMNNKTADRLDKMKPAFTTPVVKSNTVHKQSQPNFQPSNLSKSMGSMETNSSTKPRTRGVSPSMRLTIISGISDETPPNLRTTNRPTSATRGRPSNQNLTLPQKQEINSKIRRQSCSPSATRDRKMDNNNGNDATQNSRAKFSQNGNRAQVLGSRMVDKFMNARNSSAEDRQGKIKLSNSTMNESLRIHSWSEETQAGKMKLNGSMNESFGFGRLMSKSSLDMALKHMEIQREPSNIRKHGVVPAERKY